jgi:hypothetical protein
MFVVACVICHKLESYVDKAIASIVTQTRKPDLILLVGTDCRIETRAALEHWECTTHPIQLAASDTPLTCCQSKNFCADLVTERVTAERLNTEEVAFFTLDADDWIEERFLEVCLRYMEAGSSVVGCDYQFAMPTGFYKPATANETDIVADITKFNPLPSCSLIRLSDFIACGGYSENTRYEDWCLWIRMHYAGFRLFRYPQTLFNYRQHAANLSRGYNKFEELWRTRRYAKFCRQQASLRPAIQGRHRLQAGVAG